MMKRSQIIYSGNGWNMTVRELMFSIVIVLIMLTGGFFISEKIASHNDEQNQEYYQAMQIDGNAELFQYGMRTNVGNAFVKGTLTAVDPVTYPDIDGEYAYIERVQEEYTEHKKKVYEYDDEGNETGYHYETYWEWDEIGREEIHSQTETFLDVEFPYGTITFPESYYLDTVEDGWHLRSKYYVVDTSYNGVIYANLKDNTIAYATPFIQADTIDEAVDYMVSNGTAGLVIFWFVWIILIGVAVFGFCYFDNKWLED